jgi:hypothetical protein
MPFTTAHASPGGLSIPWEDIEAHPTNYYNSSGKSPFRIPLKHPSKLEADEICIIAKDLIATTRSGNPFIFRPQLQASHDSTRKPAKIDVGEGTFCKTTK